VPLRILGLGKQPADLVQADVLLLTDREPALLPGERDGLALTHSEPATDLLLDDLRSDDGMAWVPEDAWLTKLEIDSAAGDLTYDLAVDASGFERPSPVAAGFQLPSLDDAGGSGTPWTEIALLLAMLAAVWGLATRIKPRTLQS
jgi:hypothetical protein